MLDVSISALLIDAIIILCWEIGILGLPLTIPGFILYTVLKDLVALVLTMLLEGISWKYFAATPGKSIFGMTVVTKDGTKASSEAYHRHARAAWFFGYGMGVPFVDLILWIHQAIHCWKKGNTSYDSKLGLCVLTVNKKWWKTILGLFFLCVCIGGENFFFKHPMIASISQKQLAHFQLEESEINELYFDDEDESETEEVEQ